MESIEPQATGLEAAAVAGQAFQPADEPPLEEACRVERGLARVAVEGLGQLVEKVPVEQLVEPAVEIPEPLT